MSSPSHLRPFDPDSVESVDAALTGGVTRQLRWLGEWVTSDEYADIRQVAWLDWLETVHRGDLANLYRDVAARCGDIDLALVQDRQRGAAWTWARRIGQYAAWNWIKRNYNGAPASLDAGAPDLREAEAVRPAMLHARRLPRWMDDPLFTAFLGQRAKKGARGEKAAKRDVAVIRLAIEGYSDDGIALELGCTPSSAQSWRAQAKARLRRIAADGGIDTPDHPATANGQDCARCGASAHSLHHVVPQRDGGASLETVPLCLDCHSEAENYYMRQERPGMTPDDWRTIFTEWLQSPLD